MENAKKRICKWISIPLILSMLIPLFAACAENNETGTDTSNDAEAVIDSAVDSAESEDLGEEEWLTTGLEKVDMESTEFVFLSANWGQNGYQDYEIWAEETTGEGLNDAIYDRNLYMNENFNCTIRVEPAFDASTAKPLFVQSIMAQDNAYNFFIERINQYQALATEGYLYDLAKIPHVDYEKIYWDTNSYDAMSIAGFHFAVCSDITLIDKNNTSMMLFNKEIYDTLQLEDPYQIVRDGKWTLDVLQTNSKLVSQDLNGDSVFDEDDLYGFAHERDTLLSFMNGSGYYIAAKNSDDIPELTLGQEAVTNSALRIMELLYDDMHVYNLHKKRVVTVTSSAEFFQNDQALYQWSRGADVFMLREMETDFGILPIPKGSEEQENYYSDVNAWTGVCLVLPIDTPDDMLDWTGIFLEEYACQGRNYIIPVYYDSLLTSKIARDEESSEMLDIIFSNRIYDPGVIGNYLGFAYNFVYLTMSNSNNVASFVKSSEKSIGKSIGKMVEAITNKYGE